MYPPLLRDAFFDFCKCPSRHTYLMPSSPPIAIIPSVSAINDSVQHVTLDTACRHTVHMWRVQEHSVLVVAVSSTAPKEDYFPHIEEALELIEQGGSVICTVCAALCTVLLCCVVVLLFCCFAVESLLLWLEHTVTMHARRQPVHVLCKFFLSLMYIFYSSVTHYSLHTAHHTGARHPVGRTHLQCKTNTQTRTAYLHDILYCAHGRAMATK